MGWTHRTMIGLGLLLLAAAAGAQDERTCAVRYVSAEHVYLDAGTAAGLEVGLRARVVRGGAAVVELEVVYAAEHSASCRVIGGGAVEVGDEVRYTPAIAPPRAEPAAPEPRRRVSLEPRRGSGPAPTGGLSFTGRVALQWDRTAETGDGDLTTDLFSLPFRIESRGLGRGFEFRSRGTLRRIEREGFPGSTPAGDWRHRIREAALVRDGRDHAWHWSLGRVAARGLGTVGPFDGLYVGRRAGSNLRVGAFGGFAPTWGEMDFSAEDRVHGLTARYDRRGAGGRRLDTALTVAGRYRDGEVSREYLTLNSFWSGGGRLTLRQGLEVDYNRDWRRDAAGRTWELTGGALSGRYQATDRLALDLGFDDREPVRTWETRSLPDSLFTDAGRTGWRAGARWRSPGGLRVVARVGLRLHESEDEDVTSWRAALGLPRGVFGPVDWTASARGFDGPWLKGWSPALNARGSFASGLRWQAAAGHFSYTSTRNDETRTNTWGEAGLDRDLAAGWHAQILYRQDWGDDIVGRRWFLELGRRF